MKKFMFGVFVFAGLLCGGTTFAESELDTVDNNNEVTDYYNMEMYSLNDFESSGYEGTGVTTENAVIPDLPDDVEYISDLEEGSPSAEPEKIIGSDNRKIVADTTVNPYRKVIFLSMKFPNGKRYIGSGNMISSDTVLTAGHCIYSKNDGGWATSVEVYPGYNGSYAPYGVAYSKKLMSVKGWIDNSSSAYDIGAIKLDRSIGNSVGWFGLTTGMTSPITLSGYHGDLNKRMGTETGNILKHTDNNVYYTLDSTGGSSGSGVYNNKDQILAVHAYAGADNNFGTKINNANFRLIQQWINPSINYNQYHSNSGKYAAKLNTWVYNNKDNFTSNTQKKAIPKYTIVDVKAIDFSASGYPRLVTNEGYLSANKDFFVKVVDNVDQYITTPQKLVTKENIWVYSNKDAFSKETQIKSIPKDTMLDVRDIAYSKDGWPRLVTSLGYISANKGYVKPVISNIDQYITTAGKVEVKENIWSYNDKDSFSTSTQKQKINKGTILSVQSIIFSKDGWPRLVTDKGYVSANKQYVSLIK
ncbi:DUF5776 domain-containing protein [Enterococcus ureasiticus]|uniref:Serine protease n=1 Tax=Enterococcus ureasiticus TaxID=903984 RepID=A0A1E5GL68_9ENTE|nr:DUF5776 domain-containing protein [Enterococcus ureasiticus]OEG13443.1 hypothetical protein BCR21_00165 [Enterococcus ureasiticus]